MFPMRPPPLAFHWYWEPGPAACHGTCDNALDVNSCPTEKIIPFSNLEEVSLNACLAVHHSQTTSPCHRQPRISFSLKVNSATLCQPLKPSSHSLCHRRLLKYAGAEYTSVETDLVHDVTVYFSSLTFPVVTVRKASVSRQPRGRWH